MSLEAALPTVEVLKSYSLQSEERNSIEFQIDGVKCGECVRKIEKAFLANSRVADYQLSLNGKRVRLQAMSLDDYIPIISSVRNLGFEMRPLLPNDCLKSEREEFKRSLKEIAVAGVCAGNIMLFSIAVYLGAAGEFKDFFLKLSMTLSLPVLFYSSATIFKGMWRGLLKKSFNLDIPIGLALVFGYIYSFASLIQGSDEVYFDSLVVVVFLILTSRFFIDRYLRNVVDRKIGEYIPGVYQATILTDDGVEKSVSIMDLKITHKVLVKKSQIVPVDGTLRSDEVLVDNSVINGESEPVLLRSGEAIYAGSKICHGIAEIKPQKLGADSRIGKIIDSSLQSYQKSRHENLRFVSLFTFFVLAMSGVVFGYFGFQGLVGEGFRRSFAMIIVACPCAVSFGFPLIRYFSSQLALKKGILLKSPAALSHLLKIKHIVFDKTGTLTASVTEVSQSFLSQFSDFDLKAIMAIESQVDHPISRGILKHNTYRVLPEVLDFKYVPKVGVLATVGGHFYEIIAKPKQSDVTQYRSGEKFLFVYKDDVLLGLIEVYSHVRPSVEDLFKFFEERRVSVSILSGDLKSQVGKVWSLVPQTIRKSLVSEASPEEKEEFISQLGQDSIMVGDGINDVAALKRAGIGVSLPGALESHTKLSDIALLKNDLGLIRQLFFLSHRVMSTERRLFAFTIVYNLSCVSLATLGLIQPIVAAILMPVSSLIVINIIFWSLGRELWR